MKIDNYSEYILEKQIYQLLLESKVVYSIKFINILDKMKANRLAKELLKIYSQDVDAIVQNYIDVTDVKDTVSFTPDRKVQELNKDKPEIWVVVNNSRHLTNSDANNHIFTALEYDKNSQEPYRPENGAKGIILKETVSAQTGNIYVIFQDYGVESPKISIMNKAGLQLDKDDAKVWQTSRNNIKIGRLVKALLNAAKVTFTNPELEAFVNQYKATFDFLANILNQFDVVTGKKIAYWYYYKHYEDGDGTLNNSCMSEVDPDYFEIYTTNKNVSLVILYDDEGTIGENGKYTSTHIKGRAILWNAYIDGVGDVKFMDRIYTVQDSDVELFKQYAEKNKFWYKTRQSMNQNEKITNGIDVITPHITVKIENGDFDYYPYTDTLSYVDIEKKEMTNYEPDASDYDEGDDHIRLLRDTEGGWDYV